MLTPVANFIKQFTLVNYDSRVVRSISNFLVSTTLESYFTSVNCFIRLATEGDLSTEYSLVKGLDIRKIKNYIQTLVLSTYCFSLMRIIVDFVFSSILFNREMSGLG